MEINNNVPATLPTSKSPGTEVSRTSLVSAEQSSGASAEAPPVSEQDKEQKLEAAVSNINDHVQNLQRSLKFQVSEDGSRAIVQVIDSETDELIRQIPTEQMQAISEALEQQLNEGVLLKVKV